MHGQQERSKAEQEMSDWERDALDRRRQDENTDRAKHPAIIAELREINRKLYTIFAKLLELAK